jgi:hypothetical protein
VLVSVPVQSLVDTTSHWNGFSYRRPLQRKLLNARTNDSFWLYDLGEETFRLTGDGNGLECALGVVDLYEDAEGGGHSKSGGYWANCGLHI